MSFTDFAPIAGEATWRPVMQAAGYRCQCTGGCGRDHAKEPGGRCKREHKPSCHLVASPVNPTGNPHKDMTGEQVAYCPTCFNGHKNKTNRAAEAAAKTHPLGASLFDLDGDQS